MITPIRAETFAKLGFDTGMLLKNFDYSTATDAASLATLAATAKAAGTTLLGATKGGITLTDTPEYHTPTLDGLNGPVKGARHIIGRTVKASGTLVELTGARLKDIIGAADVTVSGNITTITPRASLADADYLTTLVWIGEMAGEGLVLVKLDNALNTNGFNFTAPTKDNQTYSFEFTAHMTDPDTVPYETLLFAKAES